MLPVIRILLHLVMQIRAATNHYFHSESFSILISENCGKKGETNLPAHVCVVTLPFRQNFPTVLVCDGPITAVDLTRGGFDPMTDRGASPVVSVALIGC